MLSTAEIATLIAHGRQAAFYNDRTWRKLAKQVMREQHNECQFCRQIGKYKRAEVVHHVQHLKAHPELAYSRVYLDDRGKKQVQLVALCRLCHEEVHGRVGTPKNSKYKNSEKW